ncbi:MAG: histidine triad nucleotide-binding protein [Clostridiales bacterium]|nr:histidine triad nucleotide-binding protein [Clostridiales bacterium]
MCIFCDIVEGKIPSTKVYEDESVIAIRDLNPQAPVHVLVIPRKHFDNIVDMAHNDDGAYSAAVVDAIAEVAKIEGIEDGFRVINNCGEDGGQSVMHVHFHVLGGAKLGEKIL